MLIFLNSFQAQEAIMSTNIPLRVSLEIADEFKVQEIHPDGTEVYKQPLSMSENFTKIIQRIDFDKLSTILAEQETNGSKKEIEIPEITNNISSFVNPAQRTTFNQSVAQLDSIKAKINSALTNVSVLHDVIKIAKDQEYLVMDKLAKEATKSTDEKPITALIAKKKGLAHAASILAAAFEKLQAEQNQIARNKVDFHSELLSMRQNWRLRKKGSIIQGDLSYRSAGSTYMQGDGKFEVVRNENVTPQNPSALRVIIPKSLQGESYFVVKTIKDGDLQLNNLFETPKASSSFSMTSNLFDQPWHQKLEKAQNILFNNELLFLLSVELVKIRFPIPPISANKQIIVSLFPGLQLSISLCHNISPSSSSDPASNETPSTSSNNVVLEHSLYQLLHETHYRYLHHPMPHPTSASISKVRAKYSAGPLAYDKKQLSLLTPNTTILEQIIQQGQHAMLRLRTMYLIDSLAVEIQDPLIVPSWNYLSSPVETSVRIDLLSYGYEGMNNCRTPVVLNIGTRTVKARLRDGRVLNRSFESQELRHLLLNLISQHQVSAVQCLAKAMGWKTVSYTPQIGVGKQEPIYGTASSIVLLSPCSDRTLAIKSGPHSGIKVKLSTAPQEFYPNNLVSNVQWEQLSGPFRLVDWPRIPGKTFISKMEYMMACFAFKNSQQV